MARIATQDVHAALRIAADHLIEAGGPDKRVSRKDVEQKLDTLDGVERALTDLFFRFIDHRDYEAGAVVTVTDVEEGYLYAIEHLIDAYDVGAAGLSVDEVAKMSTIGKLAVALALDNAVQASFNVPGFDPELVEAELVRLTQGLTLQSESNASFKPIVVPLAPYAALDLDTVQRLFTDVHGDLARDIFGYKRSDVFDLGQAHGEERPFGDWFVWRRMPDDLDDPLAVELAVRTGELVDFLAANVAEPRVFAYSDRITISGHPSGVVSVFIIGRTPSGWLMGVYTASVET